MRRRDHSESSGEVPQELPQAPQAAFANSRARVASLLSEKDVNDDDYNSPSPIISSQFIVSFHH